MLSKKDKTKLAGFYNYHAEKEKEEPCEIEWDQEEYENTIDMLETYNKYLYEKLQEADVKIERIKNVYTSMQFAAPEIMYIFIEKLGNILEGEDDE